MEGKPMLHRSRIKKSLLTELTTLGVDDWLFVINVEIFLVIGVALRFYGWAVVTLVLHFVLMAVTELQPRVLQVYFRHVRQRARYTSWSALPLQRGKRPMWLEDVEGGRA